MSTARPPTPRTVEEAWLQYHDATTPEGYQTPGLPEVLRAHYYAGGVGCFSILVEYLAHLKEARPDLDFEIQFRAAVEMLRRQWQAHADREREEINRAAPQH